MEIRRKQGDKIIKEIYWCKNLLLEEVEDKGKDCDALYIWYPWNSDNRIYERYGEGLSYIEYNGTWKGKAYSALMDLRQDMDEIAGHFSKTRRYEIKRAGERDNLHSEFYHPSEPGECMEFIEFYNHFAKSKGMADISRDKVYALAENGNLTVAKISSGENEILCMHGYMTDVESRKAALYTSSSLFREKRDMSSLIGRANGLLHYQSMMHFKKKGYNIYDFGGIYMGKDNLPLQNITQYKMSLGGTLVEFDSSFIIPFSMIRMVDFFLENNVYMFRRKKIIVWGAAQSGRYLLYRMVKSKISVSCVIDNRLAGESNSYAKDGILSEFEPKDTIVIVTTGKENYLKILQQENCREYVENNSLIWIGE